MVLSCDVDWQGLGVECSGELTWGPEGQTQVLDIVRFYFVQP